MADKEKEESQIQRWLSGRSVLVTGATGFVGSVLAEKLLRSCPGLVKVYVLVRSRRGESAQKRMQHTLETELFRVCTSEAKSKINVVDGDITEPGLGLNEEDTSRLQNDVSVVFHVAASTNFSSALDVAAVINLSGTKHTIDFTRTCPHVEGFLYVSTSYCNSMVRGPIMETTYPTWIDPEDLIELSKKPNLTDAEVKFILGGHDNTYSFTKQLAEEVLRRDRGRIPVAIVRPSLGCHSEPVPGWVSNVQNGGVAFVAGAGRGVFRTVAALPDKTAEIVPVDMVVSQCIAAVWDVVHNDKHDGFSVTHCTSGTRNRITWGDYCNLIVDAARRNPGQEIIWYPAAKCRANIIRCTLFVYIFQFLPALFFQSWESVVGYGRPILNYQRTFIRGIHYVRFFTVRVWYFDTRKTQELAKRLNATDQMIFNFDVRKIHWPSYFETCVLGLRHFYHKDSPSTLKKSRKLIPIFLCLHWAAYIIFFLISVFILTWIGIPEVYSRLMALIATAFVYWF